MTYLCAPPAKVGKKKGLVVQLVRIHACHAWGREFESRPDRQQQSPSQLGLFLFELLPKRCAWWALPYLSRNGWNGQAHGTRNQKNGV